MNFDRPDLSQGFDAVNCSRPAAVIPTTCGGAAAAALPWEQGQFPPIIAMRRTRKTTATNADGRARDRAEAGEDDHDDDDDGIAGQRAPSDRLVRGDEAAGEDHVLGLPGRLDPRCHGRADLQLRDPGDHRRVRDQQHRRRPDRDRDLAHLGVRRLGGGRAVGPLWARADPADHHRLVCGVHLPLRLCADLYPALHRPRADGVRLRRRVGRRRRADRRGHPRRASRQGGGRDAERLGDRLGHRGAARDRVLRADAAGPRLACAVLGRADACGAGLLRAPVRGGARGVQGDPEQSRERGRQGEFPRDLLAGDGQDHDPDQLAVDGRAGRLLCDRHLAADIPAHRAQADGDGDGRLHRRHHHRLAHRLLGQRLAQRSHRPARQFHAVCGVLGDHRADVYLSADHRRDDAASGLPPGFLRLRHLLRPWSVHD